MIEVIATTEIAAPATMVWKILVELDQFAAWNPFIRTARGELAPGGIIQVRVQTGLGIPLHFSAKVIDYSSGRELHWAGQVGSRWIARGEHWFEIVPLGPDRVRFHQREQFSGLVPRLGRRLLEREARHGFEIMNEALRLRAEARYQLSKPSSRDHAG